MRATRGGCLVAALLAVIAAETAVLLYPRVRRSVLPEQASPALRGQRVAARLGCFGCHGDGGHGGVPNPGSPSPVPSFREGAIAMYGGGDDEIRSWILDGAPPRAASDPDVAASREAWLLRMPAFRGRLSGAELDDLVAYVRTVAGAGTPPPDSPEGRGLALAHGNGCFGCHGPAGMGGVGNPGSLKGYVPGFSGPDFRELCASDAEIREWIESGTLARLEGNPVARQVLHRQLIRMPAYRGRLSPGEIDLLVAYVRWVASR